MPLQVQHYIYSIDTSRFYTDEEWAIHEQMSQLYILRSQVGKEIDNMEKKRKRKYNENFDIAIESFNKTYSLYSKMIKFHKKRLTEQFEKTKKKQIKRELRNDSLTDNKIISIFDSSLTRAINVGQNEITEDILVVQAYFFQILEDIIKHGFTYNGENYICFTASAGQIRLKKTVFIKENTFKRVENTITCGLTLDMINKKGGMNVNKYLAYLALCNSATDEWKDFDIRKSIVVEDFETMVEAYVDLIDDKDYSIKRKLQEVPIPHMDGCGITLGKTGMVRLPYVKGLLAKMPFIDFILMYEKLLGKQCRIVKDIYGVEHDVIAEGIEHIFTKSQFKMWKYFDSWEQYQDNFIKYNCQACRCNDEEENIPDAKINYQMLQTLFEMSDEDIEKLCEETNQEIKELGTDRLKMLDVLGVRKDNTHKDNMQQALEIYPELLNDAYNKDLVKETKKSIVKQARAGKIKINGKFTFLIPDLYAFCEWLFLGIETPKGLLEDGEVYCSLYSNYEKLDCLRSPHLFVEHAVRKNKANDKIKNRELSKWFCGNGCYTSTHDVISKILQFDCDGDKTLLCVEDIIIREAEKTIKDFDIVPLYYNMQKAPAQILNSESVYNGLKSAYTSGNIGLYSNNISIILNSSDIVYGSKEDKIKALRAIKLLCMENNFVIDSAKTLYVPTRPEWAKELITNYTRHKLPHYFKYAKNKEEYQIEEVNESTVNKFEKIIKNPRLNFTAMNLGEFDFRLLMSDINFIGDENTKDIISFYDKKVKEQKFFFINNQIEGSELSSELYLNTSIKNDFIKEFKDLNYIVDSIVFYLYSERKSSRKKLLWDCFGDIIVRNLIKNVPLNTVMCERCGKRIFKKSNKTKYCEHCAKEINKLKTIQKRKEKSKKCLK